MWRTRPSAVTHARWARGSRSLATHTRPSATVASSAGVPSKHTSEQHDHALAQRGHVVGLVGRQHDRRMRAVVTQQLAKPQALLGIEARSRLVEQ